jgi:hypothetical protein
LRPMFLFPAVNIFLRFGWRDKTSKGASFEP